MHARAPLVMITQGNDWLLFFMKAKARVRYCLVKILGQVTAAGVILQGLEVHCVLWRDLLFYLHRKLPLFDIVVDPLATVRMVKGINRITEVSERSILGAALRPGVAA